MKHSPETHFLKENGRIWGLLLESDCFSEHQGELEDLNLALAIPQRPQRGIADRTIRSDQRPGAVKFETAVVKERFPAEPGGRRKWTETTQVEISALQFNHWEKPRKSREHYAARSDPSEVLTSAWSDRSVIAGFHGPEASAFGKKLLDHIRIDDVAVWKGWIKGFGAYGFGLIIAIASMTPPSVLNALMAEDANDLSLQDELIKTGILARVSTTASKMGKSDPALAEALRNMEIRPYWKGDDETAYPIILDIRGWSSEIQGRFTIEDLDDFLVGRGAIPRSLAERKKAIEDGGLASCRRHPNPITIDWYESNAL